MASISPLTPQNLRTSEGTPGMLRIKVLVIDDNEAHAEGLAELLERSGFSTMYATSGKQGLQLALDERADAVLLDLNLPDISGYEVCKQLRAEPKTANVAIIFHTAASSLGIEHLADAFLTYPVESAHICFVIEGCVARRRSVLP
jgi:DNA-binding response OmpR family regulator